MDKTTTMFY